MQELLQAKPGMYITENSVYIVRYDKNNNMTLLKNGAVFLKDDWISLKTNGKDSRLEWNKGEGKTTFIKQFLKQITSDTLLTGFSAIAEKLIEGGSNTIYYSSKAEEFLKDEKQILPEFIDTESVSQCPAYRIYNQSQYGVAALYVESAKLMGNDFYNKFIHDKRITSMLYDMSIDHNGLASAVELKAEQKKGNQM